MLDEREIRLVVTSAMSKYASENDGKKGIRKNDVVKAVAEYGGDRFDVRMAMVGGLKQMASEYNCVSIVI